MDGQVNSIGQPAHERQRELRKIEVGARVPAQAQDLQSESVAAGFAIAPQITSAIECPQNVACRTFWYAQLVADLGVGQSVAAIGRSFQYVQCALDCGRWACFYIAHLRRLRSWV